MSMPLDDDTRDLLALQLTPGLGPRLTTALLERFGSARRALSASAAELCEVPQIGQKLADKLVRSMARVNVAAELELLERHQTRLLVLGTPDYPPALAPFEDAPHLLYLRGTLTTADANAIAIVGSRHCTDYGRRVAARLAAGLVRAGVTIISGLARGIDGVAHDAALKAGGRTIAVLAGGLSRIYPPEHAELAQAVSANGGLLSEASMEQDPQAGMFPARNRIISGLSRGVVIVEAAERSGALITASHAGEQGRTVFAVPGAIDNPASAGTNALIRDGADSGPRRGRHPRRVARRLRDGDACHDRATDTGRRARAAAGSEPDGAPRLGLPRGPSVDARRNRATAGTGGAATEHDVDDVGDEKGGAAFARQPIRALRLASARHLRYHVRRRKIIGSTDAS